MQYRIQFNIILLVYKAQHNLAPSCLSNLLTPYQPTRTLRSIEGGGPPFHPHCPSPHHGCRGVERGSSKTLEHPPTCTASKHFAVHFKPTAQNSPIHSGLPLLPLRPPLPTGFPSFHVSFPIVLFTD